MPDLFAKVIVDLSLDRVWDYRIPPMLRKRVHIGSRVNVIFNQALRTGFVVEITTKPSYHPAKIRPINDVDGERPLIHERLLRLGEWMGDYYCCPKEVAVRALLPAVIRNKTVEQKTMRVVRLKSEIDVPELLDAIGNRAHKQAEMVKFLNRTHEAPLSLLSRMSTAALAGLRAREVLEEEEVPVERDPFANDSFLPSLPLPLTEEQQVVMKQISASIEAEKRQAILIYGVTGSGKTEVYLQAIAKTLERGEDAIVLVPEIALTPQTTERFRSRFGDSVSVLHSHLSDGERFDEWNKISEGRVRIAVGARSAIFAPFLNLGLIVVDEEHEGSYKQTDQAPRYHARDVAVMRGVRENATVLLGSATPALESYYNTVQKKYVLATLSKRVDHQVMPRMEIVDMIEEAQNQGRPQILSRRLVDLVNGALAQGEQVILFLNRRGYATHMQCLNCGYTAECDDCSVKFTYHRQINQLVCHFCGDVRKGPEVCPACQDENIRYGGLGTEKVEAAVKGTFKGARVLRMDSDTMTRKNSYREALTAFRAGSVDILIGTQMIAKGLHFPNVTLVGVIYADMSLNLPDFRAAERTFQLLVQVAGRAGRGDLPGRVVVQTYTPFHPAIQTGLKQDYRAFYEDEVEMRLASDFPPASHMVNILLRGPEEMAVANTAQAFADFIAPALPEDTTLIPPMPCSIAKKRGQYHFQILLVTHQVVRLSRRLKKALALFGTPKDIYMTVDIDPQSIL